MDDLQRQAALVAGLVGGMQALERVAHDPQDDRGRHPLALRPQRAREAAQRLALDVLHHQEELALRGHDIQRWDDVRMADARGEARLVEKHCDELGVSRELRVEPLDRDGAREASGSHQAPQVHGRHPAGRDLIEDRITSDDSRRRRSHVKGRISHSP